MLGRLRTRPNEAQLQGYPPFAKIVDNFVDNFRPKYPGGQILVSPDGWSCLHTTGCLKHCVTDSLVIRVGDTKWDKNELRIELLDEAAELDRTRFGGHLTRLLQFLSTGD